MPIAPSAVSISGAAAPAMGETNTSMPASSQAIFDAGAQFAQLLGVSLATLDESAQTPGSEPSALTPAQPANLAAPQATSTESTQPGTNVSVPPSGGKITPLPSFLVSETLAEFIEVTARSRGTGTTIAATSSLAANEPADAATGTDEEAVEPRSSRDSASDADPTAQLFQPSSAPTTANVATLPAPTIPAWPSPTSVSSQDSKAIFSSAGHSVAAKSPISQGRQTSSAPSLASNIPFAAPAISVPAADANIPNTFALSVSTIPAGPSIEPSLAAISSSAAGEPLPDLGRPVRTNAGAAPTGGAAVTTNFPATSAASSPRDDSSESGNSEPVAAPISTDPATLATSSYSSITDRSLTLQFIAGSKEQPSYTAQMTATRELTSAPVPTSQAGPHSQLHTQLGSLVADTQEKSQANPSGAPSPEAADSQSAPQAIAQAHNQISSAVSLSSENVPMRDLNPLVAQLGITVPSSASASAVSAKGGEGQDPLKVIRSVTSPDSVGTHATVPQQPALSLTQRTGPIRAAAPVQLAPANADSSGSGNSSSTDLSDDTPETSSPISTNVSSVSQNSDAAPAFDAQLAAAWSTGSLGAQAQPNPQGLHVSIPASAQPASSTSVNDSSGPAQIATAPAGSVRFDANLSESSSSSTHASNTEAPLATSVRTDRASEAVDSSPLLRAWNGGDNAQTHLVQSAQIGGNLRESQVNFALQAGALGNVEVHARVAGDVVGASIGVDRHDAHAMISSTLPTLHEALSERQLRVSEVSVFQNSQQQAGSAPGDGRTSQQRDPGQQRPAANPWAAEQTTTVSDAAGFADSSFTTSSFDSNGRLSVRA